MGQLTDADRAWMRTNTVSIVDDIGDVFSVKRLGRNSTTKKSTYAEAHKTGVHMHVRAHDAGMVTAQGEPLAAGFTAFTRELEPYTEIQTTDLVEGSAGKQYIVTDIQPQNDWVELTLISYEPPQF